MFGDLYGLQALPGDADAVMEGFDTEWLSILQEALTIAGNHLIEDQAVFLAVDLNQVALKMLTAFMEGDEQRIVILLQLAKVGSDFHRRFERLGWLRAIVLEKGIGHGPELSKQMRRH